jgi:hypothetical protein
MAMKRLQAQAAGGVACRGPRLDGWLNEVREAWPRGEGLRTPRLGTNVFTPRGPDARCGGPQETEKAGEDHTFFDVNA